MRLQTESCVCIFAGVDVLITMLPSAEHVRQVYMGSDGILKAQGIHSTLTSTILLVCTALSCVYLFV